MTPALLLARDCIIYWVNVWVAPVECVFDMIESELVRRGVALEGPSPLPRPPSEDPGIPTCSTSSKCSTSCRWNRPPVLHCGPD
ncbi:hypothetical protein B5V03_24090 [Bradyrhizobium betae]|uniref:Uncharacterized protein n=1 Tax=Bradyrhizobium betae TaxID=244734 RepID=A0A4V1P553_9BRAD|nr:hypothetical protein B5V03_24090 [Bradyrhizobium betae]